MNFFQRFEALEEKKSENTLPCYILIIPNEVFYENIWTYDFSIMRDLACFFSKQNLILKNLLTYFYTNSPIVHFKIGINKTNTIKKKKMFL